LFFIFLLTNHPSWYILISERKKYRRCQNEENL